MVRASASCCTQINPRDLLTQLNRATRLILDTAVGGEPFTSIMVGTVEPDL